MTKREDRVLLYTLLIIATSNFVKFLTDRTVDGTLVALAATAYALSLGFTFVITVQVLLYSIFEFMYSLHKYLKLRVELTQELTKIGEIANEIERRVSGC